MARVRSNWLLSELKYFIGHGDYKRLTPHKLGVLVLAVPGWFEEILRSSNPDLAKALISAELNEDEAIEILEQYTAYALCILLGRAASRRRRNSRAWQDIGLSSRELQLLETSPTNGVMSIRARRVLLLVLGKIFDEVVPIADRCSRCGLR